MPAVAPRTDTARPASPPPHTAGYVDPQQPGLRHRRIQRYARPGHRHERAGIGDRDKARYRRRDRRRPRRHRVKRHAAGRHGSRLRRPHRESSRSLRPPTPSGVLIRPDAWRTARHRHRERTAARSDRLRHTRRSSDTAASSHHRTARRYRPRTSKLVDKAVVLTGGVLSRLTAGVTTLMIPLVAPEKPVAAADTVTDPTWPSMPHHEEARIGIAHSPPPHR